MSDSVDQFHTIPAEAAKVWCDLLTKPETLQVKGHLHGFGNGLGGNGYCCLGVYALSQGGTFEERMDNNDEYDPEDDGSEKLIPSGNFECLLDGKTINDDELLDQVWADQHGISFAHQAFLSSLNDGSSSFVLDTNPWQALNKKYALKVTAGTNAYGTPGVTCEFKEHSFAEIAKIVEEEFVKV